MRWYLSKEGPICEVVVFLKGEPTGVTISFGETYMWGGVFF